MRAERAVTGGPAGTMDITDVRRHHLSVVLDQLLRNGPRSRATLAQETGLTKGTVSTLVADLLDRDLVEELDTLRDGRVGRPGTEVGGRPPGGRRSDSRSTSTGSPPRSWISPARSGPTAGTRATTARSDQVGSSTVCERSQAMSWPMPRRRASAASAARSALPGLVDPAAGTLFVAPNLHWFDADLAAVTSRLGLRETLDLTFDNEANLAALAELRVGAGQGLSSFVYVSGGIGIGAGIVLDGRLARGAHGFAGELGHVIVEPGGRPCTCGARGCLETIAGVGADASTEVIAEALAASLRSVVHLIDPEAIVLGGTFADLGDDFAGNCARPVARHHARRPVVAVRRPPGRAGSRRRP